MKIEADIGAMQIATKSCMRQGMESPLEPPEGVQPLKHLEFGFLPFRTVRKTVLSHPMCDNFFAAAAGNQYTSLYITNPKVHCYNYYII